MQLEDGMYLDTTIPRDGQASAVQVISLALVTRLLRLYLDCFLKPETVLSVSLLNFGFRLVVGFRFQRSLNHSSCHSSFSLLLQAQSVLLVSIWSIFVLSSFLLSGTLSTFYLAFSLFRACLLNHHTAFRSDRYIFKPVHGLSESQISQHELGVHGHSIKALLKSPSASFPH